MSYPGNSSLSQEIRERLLNTFSQTLELTRQGNAEEARLGCDFILRMDPLFQPAKVLLDRLKQAQGPIDVSDLAAAVPSVAAPSSSAPPPPIAAAKPVADEEDPDLLWGVDETTEVPGAGEAGTAPVKPAPPQPAARVPGSPAPPQGAPPIAALGSPTALPDIGEGLGTLEKSVLGSSLEDGLQAAKSPQGTTPPPVKPAPAAAGSDSDARIQELLREGEAAFDQGEFQTAIDAWSRIFLIDVDHAQASQRIEQARKLKAESERKVDEVFHNGVAHFEAGRHDKARASFENVLALQPGHLAAKDYLQQLDSGAQPPPAADLPPPPVAPVPSVSTPGPAASSESGMFSGIPDPELPPLPFPEDAEDATLIQDDVPVVAAPTTQKPGRSFVLIGSVVLLVVVVGGWFLFSNWGSLFPNSEDATAAAAKANAPDPIADATRLHLGGDTALAIDELRKIPPDDPNYDRAQLLLSQWGAEPEGRMDAADQLAAADRIQAERMAHREALLDQARRAYSEGEYLPAVRAFRDAGAIAELDGPAADLYEDAKTQLRPIMQQIELYVQREWELILPTLWRKHDEDPDNRDVTLLLINSYYNLGLRSLRREDPADAAAKFREALSVDPEDPFTQRLLLFAQTYEEYPPDLLYKIFVKQLTMRK